VTWNVDREIVQLGFFALRWYSLLFASGFVLGYFVVRNFFRAAGKSEEVLDSLLFHLVVGTVVGARLGHCLLYEPNEYLHDPIRILKIWEGGLASHGGFAGVMIALLLFARKHPDTPFFWLVDRVTIPTMVEAACIRIGNFFNSEIIGKPAPADLPWAVTFLKVDNVPRHPTQIYEALGYLTVAAVTYVMYKAAKGKPLEGRIVGVALALAFTFRAVVETYKINQVAFEDDMTYNMGQLLSIPYVLVGLFFAFGLHHKVKFFRTPLWLTAEARGESAPAASEPAARQRAKGRP
jgi:prolipoprotein diacylglyceryl transferase